MNPKTPRLAGRFFCTVETVDPLGLSLLTWSLEQGGWSPSAARVFELTLGEGLLPVVEAVSHPIDKIYWPTRKSTEQFMTNRLNSGDNVAWASLQTAGYGASSIFGSLGVMEAASGVDVVEQRFLSRMERFQRGAAGGGALMLAGTLGYASSVGDAGKSFSLGSRISLAKGVAGMADDVLAQENPLKGTIYTSKVRSQIRPNLKTGITDNHGFPLEVDNFANQGIKTIIKGGDGIKRIQLDGSFRGSEGIFEWIIEENNTVNHRLFVPN